MRKRGISENNSAFKQPQESNFGVKGRYGFLHNADFKRKAQPFLGLGGPISTPQGGLGTVVTTAPIFYDIRYFTPDKFYFPRSEVEQNDVWRLIYKRDPIVGAALDLYADFAWSEFDLLGVDDNDIRKTYEEMCASLNLLSRLPDMSREFLITGKVIPHLIFSEAHGYWKYMFIHNPDFIRVLPIPFAGTEPVLDMRVPPEIKELLINPDPRVQEIVQRLPENLRVGLLSNAFIPLDNINVSFIPRRTLASDWKGTSILERLYRMLMFEDFLMNAALAVAQRNAVPLRLFKLGDHTVQWFPTKEDEQALAELLAIAEADPMSALLMHSGIEVEYVGVSDRFWNVSREWDFIENVKLVGLGVSKSFLVGEASFASAVAGLQTFVQKVSGLRMKFETEWIIPKLFRSVAKMNQFYKREEAELAHRIRVVKEERDLIVPQIKWRRALEPTQDTSLLSVWRELHDKGIISDRTYASGAGVSLDIERKNQLEERKYKEELEQMEKEKEREQKLANIGKGTGYHVPSKYIHSNIFDEKGNLENIHYSKFEPVIAFLRGKDVPEFKGINRMSLSDVYNHLRNEKWTQHELNGLTTLLEAEGFIATPDKIMSRIDAETSNPSFLSGIIEKQEVN